MSFSADEVFKTTKYDSIKLEEYEGKYSITAIQNGADENFYLKWIYQSVFKNGESQPNTKLKPMPERVILGDKETAIKALKYLLRELGVEDDIPF